MKIEDLKEICARQREMGLKRVTLTKPCTKYQRFGEYVNTPFGRGEIACVNDAMGVVVFWMDVDKIEKWIKKAEKEQAFYESQSSSGPISND